MNLGPSASIAPSIAPTQPQTIATRSEHLNIATERQSIASESLERDPFSNDDFIPVSQNTRVRTYNTQGSARDVSNMVARKPPPPLPPRKEGATVVTKSIVASPFATTYTTPISVAKVSAPLPSPSSKASQPSPPIVKATTAKSSSPASRPPKPAASPSASNRAFQGPATANPHAAILGFGTQNLSFPSKSTISGLPKVPRRSVMISPTFSSLNDYKKQFSEAIMEEINHGILPIAIKFRSIFDKHCRASNGAAPIVTATAKNAITLAFKQVYYDCDLVSYAFNNSKKRKSVSFEEPTANASPLFYLKLPAASQNQETSGSMQKDDLWLISTHPAFEPTSASDGMFFARSAMHGRPTSVMEIKPFLEGAFGSRYKAILPKVQNGELLVHAIHVMSIGSDICMLDALMELSLESMPLLPWSLGTALATSAKPLFSPALPSSEVQSLLHDFETTYTLNEDQLRVFRSAALWFDASQQKKTTISPFVLVHGVFGSGKSYMLVLLIMFLSSLYEKMSLQYPDPEHYAAPKLRILVSAATNTAVDRLLVGLLDEGYTDFVRVGSLKRINSRILPHSIHREKGAKNDDFELKNARSTASDAASADRLALRDLDDLLRSRTLTSVERALIEQQKHEIESGTFERRLALIESATVVGATCIATTFPILQNATFDIVILDECSQMPEPLSLLPSGKFKSKAYVLVGDPLQLPPQLRCKPRSDELEMEGLGFAWFSRLSQGCSGPSPGLNGAPVASQANSMVQGHQTLSHKPILLRKQYRLHPMLSSLSNHLFYGGQLLDGVSAAFREPVDPALPTLLFIDNEQSQEKIVRGGSIENPIEGKMVLLLLQHLIDQFDVQGERIGVICLYKAQADLICNLIATTGAQPNTEHLKDDLNATQVSTVDAFQGAERDIIILSTCRTAEEFGFKQPGGFLESPYRMNVSLTRGRHHLIIIGSAPVLSASKKWNTVLNTAKAAGDRSYISGKMILSNTYFKAKV